MSVLKNSPSGLRPGNVIPRSVRKSSAPAPDASGAITLAAAMGESMTPEATKRRGPLRLIPILVVPVIL